MLLLLIMLNKNKMNKDNKGNWEYSFFQKKFNVNDEANIKVSMRPDNGFNPKYIHQYINPELSKEEIILNKKKNNIALKSNESIILDNYLKKIKEDVTNDINMIEKFSLSAKVTTSEGKTRLLLHTLDYQLNKGNHEYVANIYLRLKEEQFTLEEHLKKEYSKQLKQMEFILNKVDLIKLQMTTFHTQMPPLNSKGFSKLDEWQIEVISNIDNNISTLVSAPTSAGKSVLAGYVTIKGRSLFVVPTDALAWQTSAYIGNIIGSNVPILTPTFQSNPNRNEMIELINKAQCIVGTPNSIMDYLPLVNCDFKWVIFDEIHMIGSKEGYPMEMIAKLLNNVPILALSATIGNIDMLVDWFKLISPKQPICKVVCNKRFFNLQRYYYDNNNLNLIHPLATINIEEIRDGSIYNKSLQPTPPDIWDLAMRLSEYFDLKELSPYKFFDKTERIHLDKANLYFNNLIKYIVDKKDDINIVKLLNYYQCNFNPIESMDIVKLAFTLKTNKKTPAIIFQKNTVDCLETVKNFAIQLDTMESARYPRLIADRMKIDKNNKRNEKKNDKVSIDEKCERKVNKMMMDTKKSLIEVNDVSLYEPHIDFILNDVQYFSESLVNTWIEMLKQYFPNNGDNCHHIIKLLWRGIGVYTKGLPDPYLRLVQTLASKKQLAIVFSDESLIFGISMPFRTVVVLNDDSLDPMLYHQMAGRAGRRGLDKEGNVIFYGFSWDRIKELSTSKMPSIEGHVTTLTTLEHAGMLSSKLDWNKLKTNFIKDDEYEYDEIDSNMEGGWAFTIIDNYNYLDMMWKCRDNYDSITISYLLPFILKGFETKIYSNENNQVELAHFLCRFIYTQETENTLLYMDEPDILRESPFNTIKNKLKEIGMNILDNIDKSIYVSIQQNTIYKCDDKLRQDLLAFGHKLKYIQHYFFHQKIVNLTRLFGKLLTRIWWIYHMSSPIMN
jgi:hypothetical protein